MFLRERKILSAVKDVPMNVTKNKKYRLNMMLGNSLIFEVKCLHQSVIGIKLYTSCVKKMK